MQNKRVECRVWSGGARVSCRQGFGGVCPDKPCKLSQHKHNKACSKCGSSKVIMFDSNNDVCQKCGEIFPGT